MKKGLTELIFILDRSGSMYGLEKDTIGGYNSMLEKQKNIQGECKITTVLFNHKTEVIHNRVDMNEVRKLTEKDYEVYGNTALLDAIGESIENMVSVERHTKEEYQAEKILFVIITDGMENSSREYSLSQIKTMIENQRKNYNWEFIFLGANIDSIETARILGIDEDNAVNYHADKKGTELNYKVMADTISDYRRSGKIEKSSLNEIRRDYKNRG
ncbi:VWA domain-containing protein [Peptoniphilus sp. MSJ-1]|uniref:VWA domain-containing protein n=1 Tax=Peptoniphilus ovalis TaxID=2841503 RepID=A0ABS6FDZ3_9FIRM|nr:vWA domain-containing protein [Peptoniphilus ovalis]MBU5668408.1 VWA domain-containing protein [Peptoniphilus ovalis]